VKRVADRGAIAAAYVGVGMAVTIVASFTLIIPIEGLIWLFALPSGLLIGYYANQRSNRRAGPWRRIISNGLFASLATGLALIALLLVLKALFFFADSGYRDPGLGGTISCSTGADCVYQRYLDDGRGDALAAARVTDTASFTAFYWGDQLSTATIVLGLTLLGGLGGAVLYGLARPKPAVPATIVATR
jgi:hypothetical protein